jgi:transcriptional regulator with XRE-family HTH domain
MSLSLARELAPYRRASDFSARRLAQFAGLAPSAVTRIENGQMQPTFDVARELLTLVGSPLVSPAGDTAAAIAVARKAIDGVSIPLTDGMREWVTRWRRGGLIGSEGSVFDQSTRDELLRRTARVTRVPTRPGLRTIPQRSWRKAVVALDEAGIDYALSGSPAANTWVSSAPDAEAVLYVSNIDRAETTLWEMGKSGDIPRLFLLPFDGVSERNRLNVDGVFLASLTQIVIDCLGLPGRQPAQAEAIIDNWEWENSDV